MAYREAIRQALRVAGNSRFNKKLEYLVDHSISPVGSIRGQPFSSFARSSSRCQDHFIQKRSEFSSVLEGNSWKWQYDLIDASPTNLSLSTPCFLLLNLRRLSAQTKQNAENNIQTSENVLNGGLASDVQNHDGQNSQNFQHEEIVGPTVEKDLSAAANEFRKSISTLVDVISGLKSSLIAMGILQLVAGSWISYFNPSLQSASLWVCTSSTCLSFVLAYLLHQTMKPVSFFSTLEGRSRLKVITLALQVIKALSNCFARTKVVVKLVAVILLAGLSTEMWSFWIKKLQEGHPFAEKRQ